MAEQRTAHEARTLHLRQMRISCRSAAIVFKLRGYAASVFDPVPAKTPAGRNASASNLTTGLAEQRAHQTSYGSFRY